MLRIPGIQDTVSILNRIERLPHLHQKTFDWPNAKRQARVKGAVSDKLNQGTSNVGFAHEFDPLSRSTNFSRV